MLCRIHLCVFGRGGKGARKKEIVFCFLVLYIQLLLERVRAPDTLDYCSITFLEVHS